MLVCPFCGTESPYQIDRSTGTVAEQDLLSTLRDLPEDQRGWQSERRSVQCQSCRAVMVYEAGRVGQKCEFCGSPALVAYEETKSPIRPQAVLPFRIDRNQVRDSIRRWWRTKWLAPARLATAALIDTVRSLYIPYWTFDARAHCPWDADAGHYYYVSVEGRNSQGKRVVRQERRTRWSSASGIVEHAFDDEAVPGTHGVPLALLRKVEPFPTREVVPYDTAFLSGHIVEHYQVVLLDAASRSEAQMHATLERLCAADVPGDTYRNLRIRPVFSGQTFKHLLVPIWLLTYTFGRTSYQVLVNGCTGRIAGQYPFSAWKIALVVAAALALAVLIIALN
mgnify:CR=1 FL=1